MGYVPYVILPGLLTAFNLEIIQAQNKLDLNIEKMYKT
jgi:hypothetical protein